MKLYSDTLTMGDLEAALPKGTEFEHTTIRNPRARRHGWNVNLICWASNRHRNSGTHGADRSAPPPATWDQYGEWMAALYEIDSQMQVANYKSADDFHAKTDGQYRKVSA